MQYEIVKLKLRSQEGMSIDWRIFKKNRSVCAGRNLQVPNTLTPPAGRDCKHFRRSSKRLVWKKVVHGREIHKTLCSFCKSTKHIVENCTFQRLFWWRRRWLLTLNTFLPGIFYPNRECAVLFQIMFLACIHFYLSHAVPWLRTSSYFILLAVPFFAKKGTTPPILHHFLF